MHTTPSRLRSHRSAAARRARLSLGLATTLTTLGLAALPPAHAGGLDPLGFTSLGTLNTASNITITANGTAAPTMTLVGGGTFTGVYVSQGTGLPEIAVFDFTGFSLAAGGTLSGTTSVPIAILSQSSLTVNGAISANGFGGGAGAQNSDPHGGGPGGGSNGSNFSGGGGGGFGGDGGSGSGSGGGGGGASYGNLAAALQGGSGGGLAPAFSSGGNGGGGLELSAVGLLTTGASTTLAAIGAVGGNNTICGGGGSGGGVFLNAGALSLAGSILASGGAGGGGSSTAYGGGGGGGGRVLLSLPEFTAGTTLLPTATITVAGGAGGSGNISSGSAGAAGTAGLAVDIATVPTGQTLALVNGILAGTPLSFSANLITVQSGGAFANTGGYTNPSGAEIALNAADARLTGGLLTNSGLLDGSGGRIEAAFANASGGEIRAASGSDLVFTAAGDTNAGTINLLGGTADFRQGLANTGSIAGHGTLSAGGAGLANTGTVAFSQNTDVLGAVSNTGGGTITTTGGAVVTFYNDVVHNGAEIRTAAGSRTVFLGNVSGAGPFTGPGLVDFEGAVHPGNSPAAVTFGGDVLLGSADSLDMELGGTTAGSGYDQLRVADSLTLGGALDVSLLNGFTPTAGEQFDLLDWGTASGAFSSVSLPTLSQGLTWDTSALYTDGQIAVAPEPSAWASLGLGALGLGALAFRARKRRAA